ncbi:hypothetical protein Tsubulata_007665 [Turnera subulata]|uniref:Uncharacterized protein n=1 Tax=Turnera subulata TaxID=218843 RepID=A0A9Q0FQ91_9ROSI|nr:hypothetical protein Tsubulata_007665 [Turnera subulata]
MAMNIHAVLDGLIHSRENVRPKTAIGPANLVGGDASMRGHPAGSAAGIPKQAGVGDNRPGSGAGEVLAGLALASPPGGDLRHSGVIEARGLGPDAGVEDADDDVVGGLVDVERVVGVVEVEVKGRRQQLKAKKAGTRPERDRGRRRSHGRRRSRCRARTTMSRNPNPTGSRRRVTGGWKSTSLGGWGNGQVWRRVSCELYRFASLRW